jgi:hypothetical protein
MPLPPEGLLFSVQMALRKALKTVLRLRKQIGERDERVMAIKFVSEISIAYDIVRKPGEVGQMVGPPTGPETKEPHWQAGRLLFVAGQLRRLGLQN